jgi:uncharacterized Fe-S cluster-containing radical SAM superfamily protein
MRTPPLIGVIINKKRKKRIKVTTVNGIRLMGLRRGRRKYKRRRRKYLLTFGNVLTADVLKKLLKCAKNVIENLMLFLTTITLRSFLAQRR